MTREKHSFFFKKHKKTKKQQKIKWTVLDAFLFVLLSAARGNYHYTDSCLFFLFPRECRGREHSLFSLKKQEKFGWILLDAFLLVLALFSPLRGRDPHRVFTALLEISKRERKRRFTVIALTTTAMPVLPIEKGTRGLSSGQDEAEGAGGNKISSQESPVLDFEIRFRISLCLWGDKLDFSFFQTYRRQHPSFSIECRTRRLIRISWRKEKSMRIVSYFSVKRLSFL